MITASRAAVAARATPAASLPVQREEHPADRGFAPGAAVRAAEAATRVGTDLRAAARTPPVVVEDAEETRRGNPTDRAAKPRRRQPPPAPRSPRVSA